MTGITNIFRSKSTTSLPESILVGTRIARWQPTRPDTTAPSSLHSPYTIPYGNHVAREALLVERQDQFNQEDAAAAHRYFKAEEERCIQQQRTERKEEKLLQKRLKEIYRNHARGGHGTLRVVVGEIARSVKDSLGIGKKE